MLHSIVSLTTELKVVHLNFSSLVILTCIWMSCIYVSLVCARGKGVWRTPRDEFVPHFPGCALSRGWCAARPAGGAPSAGVTAGKTMENRSRECRPWAPPSPAVLCGNGPAGHGEIRCAWPSFCSACLEGDLHEGAVEFFGCCNCNWDIGCPLIH